MQLGMIGLGKMGANMAQRLLNGGHQVTGFDPNADARKQLEGKGGGSAASLATVPGLPPRAEASFSRYPSGPIPHLQGRPSFRFFRSLHFF